MTSLLPAPLPESGLDLHAAWEENASALDKEGETAVQAEQAMMDALDDTRRATLALIQQLR